MTWARTCDLVYSLIGLLIVAGVWAFQGATIAFWTGLLLAVSYAAGGVKYRHP